MKAAPLTVLSVAYALGPVGPDAVGGAERVLWDIDRALVQAGHRSIVAACEGSQVTGELASFPRRDAPLDADAIAGARKACRERVESVLAQRGVDLTHMHGVDFAACLPPFAPALVTLHLPFDFYPASSFGVERAGVSFHAVSTRQHATAPPGLALLPPISNGVDADAFARVERKSGYALTLGRICAEKGTHLALDAARTAGAPLVVAGRTFPYPDHASYFHREVAPRLDRRRVFAGQVGGVRKQRLLARARCLLVPSIAQETSSLVAMQALASGTPVIAFEAGALPEIVEHGETGFIVADVEEMAAAIRKADSIDPERCRASARARFSLRRMTDAYLERYAALVEEARAAAA